MSVTWEDRQNEVEFWLSPFRNWKPQNETMRPQLTAGAVRVFRCLTWWLSALHSHAIITSKTIYQLAKSSPVLLFLQSQIRPLIYYNDVFQVLRPSSCPSYGLLQLLARANKQLIAREMTRVFFCNFNSMSIYLPFLGKQPQLPMFRSILKRTQNVLGGTLHLLSVAKHCSDSISSRGDDLVYLIQRSCLAIQLSLDGFFNAPHLPSKIGGKIQVQPDRKF